MEISHRVLVSGLILAWLVGSLGNAKGTGSTVDSVLAKWEEASQKCKTLDAKLTVWRYDDVFDRDHQPTITQGRFYYKAPNLGRYEIRKKPRAPRTTGRAFQMPSFGRERRRSGSLR